jgi:hypothetical protein
MKNIKMFIYCTKNEIFHNFDTQDWLIDYLNYLLFYVPLKSFSLIWRHHQYQWKVANLGLYLALRAFEQGGSCSVPNLLWHRAPVFLVSSKGPPHSVASHDTQADVEDLF